MCVSVTYHFVLVIQSCCVEPLPESTLVKRFEGKQVKDEITRSITTIKLTNAFTHSHTHTHTHTHRVSCVIYIVSENSF